MLRLITPAAVEPVTLAEAKAHLRVTHNADDALIGSYIAAAREVVEAHTGRALMDSTYLWASSAPIESTVRLPLWPVEIVTEVAYGDAAGARHILDPADYVVDLERSEIRLAPQSGWSALNVTFNTDPGTIPAALKAAILLRVQASYEASPDDAVKLQEAASRLE